MNLPTLPAIVFFGTLIGIIEAKAKLHLGLVTPPAGKLGYPRVAASSTWAVSDAQDQGYLTDYDVRIFWANGNCDGKIALGVVVDMRDAYQLDAFIGLPCSIASINAGKLIAYWNLPHFSFSSADPELEDKVTYNTLIRLMSPFNRLADAMVEMFYHYQWKRAVLLRTKDEDNYCDYAGRAINSRFRQVNFSIADRIELEDVSDPTDAQLDTFLERIRKNGRIVVVCGTSSMIRRFLLQAKRAGMTSGDYVYIYPNLLPATNYEQPWVSNDGQDVEAKEAFFPLLQMALGFVTEPEAEQFMDEHPYKMAEPPWNDTTQLDDGIKGSTFSLFVYDTVYMYCRAAQMAHDLGSTPRNGTLMFELAKNITFHGKSGQVVLDGNGDRIGDYKVWHLPVGATHYTGLLDISMTKPENPITFSANRYWGLTGLEYPRDSPECGFFEELCPKDNTVRDVVIICVAILVVLVGTITSVCVLMYRRRKFEEELELMLWKIKWDDIDFISRRGNGNLGSSFNTKVSMSTVNSGATGSGVTAAKANPHAYIRVGHFKGALVAVKMLNQTGILLTRQDHLELKIMRDISHENINPFIGACVDPPNVCVVTKYCSKGSLQDIIHNDDIKLDMNFRSSLLGDLIQGMEFLHRSPLRSHGRLKSSNCVVDGRWVLRITDWGLANFRETQEFDSDNAPFWTAPELLRDAAPSKTGTTKGDVYSFSIIMQEVLYRCGPYETAGELAMLPKDLIGRVRNGETPPLRPVLPEFEKIDRRFLELAKDGWNEDPTERPDFISIKSRFTAINKGKRFNIMDNMLRMMEKYANNLEEVINERTRQLVEEKKKTDMLLYRMLPAAVADSLKSGKSIKPELFKHASIYFSDIVSFTNLCSESTPMEVIDFLNDLWTAFDDLIEKYGVYKVETIGDAYMVASGIPTPNPDGHAQQIADMSLDILSTVMSFKIRHRPDYQLKVRIGLHCGSVVAGVVGQTMPRYCLFGDTVNTASRMESTGDALKIHISQQAYLALKASNRSYHLSKRGDIEIKGKGIQSTYWLEGKEGYAKPLPHYTD